LRWEEVSEADPRDFTMFTMPARFVQIGDLMADIDDHVFDIASLLEWAARDEAAGQEVPEEPEP
jgi:DNA primase